jgi:hypothetical protein
MKSTKNFDIRSFNIHPDPARLQFRDDISMTIDLPHVPPGTYISREVFDIGADSPRVGFATRISGNIIMNNNNFLELQPDGESDVEFIGMAIESAAIKHQIKNEKEVLVDDPQAEGGETASTWKPSNWDEMKNAKAWSCMQVELGHAIFGHHAVSSLLATSRAKVWDDIEMVFSGDSW